MDIMIPQNALQTKSDMLTRIHALVDEFRFMGAIISANKCYIDGNTYDSSMLMESPVYGCMAEYPYNIIQVSKRNEWMMDAVRLMFYRKNNIIPHTFHNLPPIFKIKRSNGTLHDATASNPLYGIRISRKTNAHGEDVYRLNVRVHFIDSLPILPDKYIHNPYIITKFSSSKDVPLHEIYKYNSDLSEFKINFIKMKKIDDMLDEANGVIESVNNEFDTWCKEIMQPLLHSYSCAHTIASSYSFN